MEADSCPVGDIAALAGLSFSLVVLVAVAVASEEVLAVVAGEALAVSEAAEAVAAEPVEAGSYFYFDI